MVKPLALRPSNPLLESDLKKSMVQILLQYWDIGLIVVFFCFGTFKLFFEKFYYGRCGLLWCISLLMW